MWILLMKMRAGIEKKAKVFYIIFETLHESIHYYSEEKPYSYGLLSALYICTMCKPSNISAYYSDV